MPNLERLVDRGVIGELGSVEPVLCPLTLTSLVTGKRADRHGVLGFVEPDPTRGGVRPVPSTSRRAKAIWNVLDGVDLKPIVVGWPHPAEPLGGACVSDAYRLAAGAHGAPWPLPPGAILPQRLEAPLADLRVHPAELTAHQLLPFVPGAAGIDQESDPRLSAVARILAECASIHAAATWLAAHEPWDLLAVNYQGVEAYSEDFMVYHPPRLAGVGERDFETYRDVVTAAYRFHDMMLGRLVELAGPEATVIVVSDHGYHCDHLRPAVSRAGRGEAVRWYRKAGVLAMAGPHVRRDVRIDGAGLLDIVPTLLVLFGLPVADDLEGRALWRSLDADEAPQRIETWEALAGPAPGDAAAAAAEWDAAATLSELVALGHVENAGGDTARSVRLARRDAAYNLARVHLDAGREDAAEPILAELAAAFPGERRFSVALALARYRLGELGGAEAALAAIPDPDDGASPMAVYVRGLLLAARGRNDEALRCLRDAGQWLPISPGVHCELGNLYLRLERYEEAASAFRRELELDDRNARAHDGLAAVWLAAGRPEHAADEALRAIGLVPDLAGAHLRLGVARLRTGRPLQAARALETCLSLAPETRAAHRWLAEIHERFTGDRARAELHRRKAEA